MDQDTPQTSEQKEEKLDLTKAKETKDKIDLELNIEEEEEKEPWENENNPPWKNVLLFVLDILLNAAIIIVVVFTIRYFFVSPFQVSGTSMLETLHNGEYILVNKLDYRIHEPERGDPIVFLPPNHRKDYYVKRIIGLPNDTVQIKNGKVFIKNKLHPEGYELEEDYLSKRFQGKTYLPTDIMNKEFTVPEDKYFVLGDNRTGSSDSRYWRDSFTNEPTPYVEKRMISGKVWAVLWPLNEIRQIEKFW